MADFHIICTACGQRHDNAEDLIKRCTEKQVVIPCQNCGEELIVPSGYGYSR